MKMSINDGMIDITNPGQDIEIEIRRDKQVLWVNVGGVCRLRICQIGDQRIHIAGPSGFIDTARREVEV